MSTKSGYEFDGYTLKARYLPALIVVLPGWLSFALWFPPDKMFYAVFASAGVTLVAGVLLAHIGRDSGKKRQPGLFKEWGGLPTTRAIAYRHSILNEVTLTRCHLALNKLVPGINLPTSEEEEKADWKGSKTKYESAVDFLRQATNDKSKFRILYAENTNYGFRRNLWGMKTGGISVTVLSCAAAAVHLAKDFLAYDSIHRTDAAAILLCATMVALWSVRFTKGWVKNAADAYAAQLIASAEVLVAPNGADL